MEHIIDLRGLPAGAAAARSGGGRMQTQPVVPVKPPDERSIAFITCVNDEPQYGICRRYIESLEVPSGYRVERFVVLGAPSMGEGYQRAMEASRARYKIYVHQDVYLTHPGLLGELLHLFRTYPRLGLVGVVGGTRLPRNGIWFVNNPLHSYGRLWEYRKPGGPSALLGPFNPKRLHFMCFRRFVGDYLPAVVVDGLFMATQYDIPWNNPIGGFDLYEQVHALQFIRAGLEVGIARQERIWCVHWGPLKDPTKEQDRQRQERLHSRAEAFRQRYGEYLGVPAGRLYAQYREEASRLAVLRGPLEGRAEEALRVRTVSSTTRAAVAPGTPAGGGAGSGREHLGIVIVTFNGRQVLVRALNALKRECQALQGTECHLVVVDNASVDATVDAVQQEFPEVTLVVNPSNEGPARGFNAGLRRLRDVDYVLVMNNDVEILDGALARMVEYLRLHRAVAGVVAALINPDGTDQYQRTATVELLPRRPRKPQPVTFVGTTCALVRWDVLVDVGLYDERFYFFDEDVEWSVRAQRKGYVFHFLPDARVIHYGSVGFRQNREAILAELFAANLWHLYKHAGPRWAAALYWAQRLQVGWRALRWRRDPERRRQALEAGERMRSLYEQLRAGDRRPVLLQAQAGDPVVSVVRGVAAR